MSAAPNAGDGKASHPIERLAAERDRFLAFAFAAGDVLAETDRDGRILFLAGAAGGLFGSKRDSLIGRSIADPFDASSRALLNALLRQVSTGGRAGPITLHLGAENGSGEPLSLRVFCPDPTRGRLYCTFARSDRATGTGSEAPETLSGLPGAEAFAAMAQKHLEAPGQHGNLLLIDLDLPEGADPTGDLHRSVGQYLQSNTSDPNGAAQLAEGRFGIFQETAEGNDALVSQLEGLVEQTLPDAAGALKTSALDMSAEGLSEGDSLRALLYCINGFADGNTGAMSVTSLADGLRAEIQDTVSRVSDMRSMLRDKAVSLRFQPIVRLATREPVHYEALARTTAGESAFEIITFAEKLGLSEELDALVFRLVLEELERIKAFGVSPKVAVNLSARSVESDVFVQVIDRLQRSSAIPAAQILFEITETSQIADLDRTARVIASIKAKGHHVCIDDFGVGATTFDYLRRLPVDVLKIDGSYVQRLAANPREAHFVKVMATLCNGLGVETVAEMVEQEHTARQLEYLGVTFGQGYLFGRPMERIEAGESPKRLQRAR